MITGPGGLAGGDADVPADDGRERELAESVRLAVSPYCRARLSGFRGGSEAAEKITHDVCRAAVEALRSRQDRGAPLAALVFAITSAKVNEAQRRFERLEATDEHGLAERGRASSCPGPVDRPS